jgi:hypothetical protein
MLGRYHYVIAACQLDCDAMATALDQPLVCAIGFDFETTSEEHAFLLSSF